MNEGRLPTGARGLVCGVGPGVWGAVQAGLPPQAQAVGDARSLPTEVPLGSAPEEPSSPSLPPPPGKTPCVSPARGLPGAVSGPSFHSWASAEGPARFRGLGLCSEPLSVLAVLLLLQYWAGVGPVSVLMLALFPLGIMLLYGAS